MRISQSSYSVGGTDELIQLDLGGTIVSLDPAKAMLAGRYLLARGAGGSAPAAVEPAQGYLQEMGNRLIERATLASRADIARAA